MIRQSMAPGALRQSHLPGQPPNAAALAKLAEKKKEFEAVVALERASGRFLKRIDDLGDEFRVMADAGIVCGQVPEQWLRMYKILGLFLASREKNSTSMPTTRPPANDLSECRLKSSSLRSDILSTLFHLLSRTVVHRNV